MRHYGPDREDADEALIIVILAMGGIISLWYVVGLWCGLPLLIVFVIACVTGIFWK